MLDVVDPLVLAQKAAAALHPSVGMSFTGVAIREESGLFAMHGVAGGRNERVLRQIRLSSGQGLGGKVVALRRPVLVTDYVHDSAITPHFRDLAVMESLGGMAAVPVIDGGDMTAIIYAATRDGSSPGDDAVTRLSQAASGLADLFGTAVRHQDAVRRQAAAERLRIAEQLHDTVGQLLFAIGASARRLRSCDGDAADLARIGELIEGTATEATAMLRDALRQLTPRAPEESLPVAVRVGVEEFSQTSGVPAHLVVLGEPRTVSADGAGALLNVVREGLHNAAQARRRQRGPGDPGLRARHGRGRHPGRRPGTSAGLRPEIDPRPHQPRRLRPAVAAAPDAATRRLPHHPPGPRGRHHPPSRPARPPPDENGAIGRFSQPLKPGRTRAQGSG